MTLGVPSASASPESSGRPPSYGGHSPVSTSRSPCSAGIKLSSFTTYWSHLAEPAGGTMVWLGGPGKWWGSSRARGIYLHDPPPGYHPPRPEIPLKDRQRQARQGPHARRQRSPDTCGC